MALENIFVHTSETVVMLQKLWKSGFLSDYIVAGEKRVKAGLSEINHLYIG